MLWPLQNMAWTASFWWFPGMIIAFTVIRLVEPSAGIWTTQACPSVLDAARISFISLMPRSAA